MKRLILFELLLIFLATTFESDSPPGWFQQTLPRTDVTIQDIFFLDSLTGHIVTGKNTNDSAFIFKTTDGGSNWVTTFKDAVLLNTVQFTDANTGYSGGGFGFARVYKTTNGGLNWVNLGGVLGFGFLEDIFFTDNNTGWVCDKDAFGGLAKTTNGGLNWQPQLDQSYQPQKLFFINNDTGWMISANNREYITTNSGMNWSQQMNFFSEDLVDIFFTQSNTGYIHGGPTGIYKSTNGGINWDTQSTPLGYGNGKMHFTDSRHGWVGRSNAKMLVTKDGLNWGYQNTPSGSHFSVQMLDTLKGWAGYTNLIHTTDGGGQMFLGIQQISTEIPTDYKLEQNYPNPFNPTTNFGFRIAKFGFVTIKIFDIAGKEMATVVNEELRPGEYKADWNAAGFASGIYFYSLIIDNKIIDTKKMILVK